MSRPIDMEKVKIIYERLVEEIRKHEPELLGKHRVFLLGSYREDLKNREGYSFRELLEMLRDEIKKCFKDVYPFLMDEITGKYSFLYELRRIFKFHEGFLGIVYFADTVILIFDVAKTEEREVEVPSFGHIFEAELISMISELAKRTYVFARKLKPEEVEKLPAYVPDIIYGSGAITFSSTSEMIDMVLNLVDRRLKELRKKNCENQKEK